MFWTHTKDYQNKAQVMSEDNKGAHLKITVQRVYYIPFETQQKKQRRAKLQILPTPTPIKNF